eukprot:12255799-Alexandrium_andersonii.AAC.1
MAAQARPPAPAAPAARSSPLEGFEITVCCTDMLEVAQEQVRAGRSVAVLNMASAFRPGGGVERGAGAQEENLHRRTDTYRYLKRQERWRAGRTAPPLPPGTRSWPSPSRSASSRARPPASARGWTPGEATWTRATGATCGTASMPSWRRPWSRAAR